MTAKQESSSEVQQTPGDDIIEMWPDQPTAIPADVRRTVEKEVGGEPIRLYAFSGTAKKSKQQWLVLTRNDIAIVSVKRGKARAQKWISRAPRRRGDAHLTMGLSGCGTPFALLVCGPGSGPGVTGAGAGYYFASSARSCEYERTERVVTTSGCETPVKITLKVIGRRDISDVRAKTGHKRAKLTLRDCDGRRLATFNHGLCQRYAVYMIQQALEQADPATWLEATLDANAVYRTCLRQAIQEDAERFSFRALMRRVFRMKASPTAPNIMAEAHKGVIHAHETSAR